MRVAPVKEIKIKDVKKSFMLIDDDIWQKTNSGIDRVEVEPNKRGYRIIKWKGGYYRYHRVYWALHTNKDMPIELEIDHIYGVRFGDHWWNLKTSDHRSNLQNQNIHRDGKLCGYYYDKRRDKYYAHIEIKDEKIHLGAFDTPEEANSIYFKAVNNINNYDGNRIKFRKLINESYKGPKGYYLNKTENKFVVAISIDSKDRYIGRYKEEDQAKIVSNKAMELRHLFTGDIKEFRELIKGEVK